MGDDDGRCDLFVIVNAIDRVMQMDDDVVCG